MSLFYRAFVLGFSRRQWGSWKGPDEALRAVPKRWRWLARVRAVDPQNWP